MVPTAMESSPDSQLTVTADFEIQQANHQLRNSEKAGIQISDRVVVVSRCEVVALRRYQAVTEGSSAPLAIHKVARSSPATVFVA